MSVFSEGRKDIIRTIRSGADRVSRFEKIVVAKLLTLRAKATFEEMLVIKLI